MSKDNSSLNLLKRQLENDYGAPKSTNRHEKWEPTAEEKRRQAKFYDDWQLAINFRVSFDNAVQEYIDRYEAKPFFYEDGRSGVVVPLAKAIIETAQAQESKNPPTFAYSPADYKEDEQKARILEMIITKHVWYLKGVDLDRKMDALNQDKMILGTMYQYVGYRKINRLIRTRTKNEDGTESFKEDMQPYYDDIVVDNIYPQDFWLHPLATCVAESPWAYVRKRFDHLSFIDTFSDVKQYKNVHLVEKNSWFESTSHGGLTRKKDGQVGLQDEVVVLEKWDKLRDEVIIYANGIEIYYGPNPYDDKELPYSDYRNRMQHNTYLGESECERTATLIDAVNAFINIAVDKEKRAGTGINLIDNNLSDFDETANIFDSASAVRVDDPKNSFTHYDIPGMASSTDRVISMLLDFLVFSTGIDFRQITDLSASTKATVAALRREISQQRIQLNVSRNENVGLRRLGWLLAKRVQQFYPIPKVEYLSGKTGLGGEETKDVKAEYRSIRIEGMEIEEDDKQKGVEKLRVKGVKDGVTSFFQARPEYIRTKGDVCVKVIPGSTFAAIQELQKTKAQEAVKMAMEITQPPKSPKEPPQPYMSVRYFLEEWVKGLNYDVDRAFDLSNKKLETPAQDAGKDVIEGMNKALGGNVKTQKIDQPMVGGQMPTMGPRKGAPEALTGQASAPVRELAGELGPANRVTSKPQ